MRRFLFTCIAGLLAASLGAAQQVVVKEVVVNAQAAPAPAAKAAADAVVATHLGGHGGHGCGTVKTCVPVPDKKKTTKTVYSCKTKDFCYPKTCSGGGCCKRDCDQPCNPGDCESCVRTKRVLLKKSVTTECPSFKCEVVEKPCPVTCAEPCATGPGCGRAGCCKRSAPHCETTVPATQPMPPANPQRTNTISVPAPVALPTAQPQPLPSGARR